MTEEKPLTGDQLILKNLILVTQKLELIFVSLSEVLEAIKERGPRRVQPEPTKNKGC